ncbi:hypothetical protein VSS92_30655, partial [Pseudomonas syringae pv. tagetis]
AGFYVRFGCYTLQFGATFNSQAVDVDGLFDAVGERLGLIDCPRRQGLFLCTCLYRIGCELTPARCLYPECSVRSSQQ